MAVNHMINETQGNDIIDKLSDIADNLENVSVITPAKFGMGLATCNTAADVAAKTCNLANYVLTGGAPVSVKFTYANTASNPTLNINGTGAKPMYYKGTAMGTNVLTAGDIATFIYDPNGIYHIINIDTLAGPGAGTVTSVGATDGITTDQSSGTAIQGQGSVKLNLKSNSAYTGTVPNPSTDASITNGNVYPVALDGDGHPVVGVPWTDTTYENAENSAITVNNTTHKIDVATGSKDTKGVVQVGDGIAVSNGTISSDVEGTIIKINSTSKKIEHDNGNGHKHIPASGAANNILVYDSEGTAKWASIPGGIGQGYGACTTAAATAAKTATLSGYELIPNGIVSIKFSNDVPANATLSINSKTAKPIYYRNAAIVANVISAGETATMIYDGTNYHVISIDKNSKSAAASSAGAELSLVTTGEKYTWNSKQNALSDTQLAAVNSGINTTKVAQISTNQTNILYTQESTIGENLIPYPYYRKNGYIEDGVVYTYDDNGVINVAGANGASDDSYFILSNNIDPKIIGSTFTLSTTSDNANSVVKYRCYYVNDAGAGVGGNIVYGFVNNVASFTYNPPENYTKIAIVIYLVKNTAADNEKITVMLEKGSVAHPYQPYKLSRENLYNESYQTAILSDKIVRLTENKDGYAYITSTAGEVIKSVGKNLINPADYDLTTSTGKIVTTSDSDGSVTISTESGYTWTTNGNLSGYNKIPITKPGTFYFVAEHISGYAYTGDAPTTPTVIGHQLVLLDASDTPISGYTTYSSLTIPEDFSTALRTFEITSEMIQAGAAYLGVRVWSNGTTSGGRIIDDFKFRVAAYLDDNTVTADTPYQAYKESIETCDEQGHCYIMTYKDGSVYSRDNFYTKTISVDYPESDFAVHFNEVEYATEGINTSRSNYIEMKSGQRVYADTTEPYGDIPVGSIGVGFDSGVREFGEGAKLSATTYPIVFGSDSTPITSYTVHGNTGGVGERSYNLIDRMNLDAVAAYPNQSTGTVETSAGASYSIIVPISSDITSVFFSINRETIVMNRSRIAGYATYPEVGTLATFVDNSAGTATDETSGDYAYNSCTIPSGTNYLMIFLASGMSDINTLELFKNTIKEKKPMLTEGTTKLPYVKYYSIPVSCNSVTSDISLDAPLVAGETVTYADSNSAIDTVNGQNTMTFGTTVQPAKVEFEYVGWHPTGEIADLTARVEALEAAQS